MNKHLKVLFCLTNMAGVAGPTSKGSGRVSGDGLAGVHRSWLEGGQGEVRGACG